MLRFSACIRLAVFGLVLNAFVPALLHGQTTAGAVNGTVRDSSGGVVPDAKVELKNESTGTEVASTTNSNGYFTFVNVQPGGYTLSASATGFKKAVQALFSVGVNETVTHNFSLSVGDVGQTVEVTSEAALLQQSTSELGTVISEEAVKELPLNGRNTHAGCNACEYRARKWRRHRLQCASGAAGIDIRNPLHQRSVESQQHVPFGWHCQ